MPAVLERCVQKVMDQGHPQSNAYAICRASLGLTGDGSQDESAPELTDEEMRARLAPALKFQNGPTLRKRVVICKAVGEYVNGSQEGDLSRKRLTGLVENFKKYPRQVPVYLLTGQPDPEHPADLDSRLADGWIEGLAMQGDDLMGDMSVHGGAATAVMTDSVRGASIGTIQGHDYQGNPIGEILEHVVLTNQPFVKGMNIAASRAKGGEKPASYFTALPKEADMADPKEKKPDPAAKADKKDDGAINFQERAEALQIIVNQNIETIEDLTASRDNLLKEVESYKENPQLSEAVTRMRGMERQLRAEKVRRIVTRMCENGQVVRDTVKWAFGDSDETVLAGFETGDFKGKIELLEFALKTYPKQRVRNFISGAPDEVGGTYTAEEKEQIRSAGKDPELLSKVRGAKNFTDYKRRKDAAAKG